MNLTIESPVLHSCPHAKYPEAAARQYICVPKHPWLAYDGDTLATAFQGMMLTPAQIASVQLAAGRFEGFPTRIREVEVLLAVGQVAGPDRDLIPTSTYDETLRQWTVGVGNRDWGFAGFFEALLSNSHEGCECVVFDFRNQPSCTNRFTSKGVGETPKATDAFTDAAYAIFNIRNIHAGRVLPIEAVMDLFFHLKAAACRWHGGVGCDCEATALSGFKG